MKLQPTVQTALWLAMLTLCAARAEPDGGSNLTGGQIMQRVDARDTGDKSTRHLHMILIDKGGDQRRRVIRAHRMDVDEASYSLLFFLDPPEVKGTGLLTYDYDAASREDDQWLYLPALKKTKRIASSDQSGSFMGSDFSYADMTKRNLDSYDYELLQDGEVQGAPVWVVEATPTTEAERDRTGYSRQILFVRKDNFVVVRAKSWVAYSGRNKYFDVRKLERIDGVWVPTEMHMTTKHGAQTLHKTVLLVRRVKFDQPMDESLFTVRQLEKGP